MAITEQTAVKSTGGRAPRKQLASKAARDPVDIRLGSEIESMHWDSNKELFTVHLNTRPGQPKQINLAEAVVLLPKVATDFSLNRPLKRLQPQLMKRWAMFEAELMLN